MPNGRIMVNCGGTSGGSEVDPRSTSSNGSLVQNSTIKALSEAFAGEVWFSAENIASLDFNLCHLIIFIQF